MVFFGSDGVQQRCCADDRRARRLWRVSSTVDDRMLIVGGGRMGEALLSGLLAAGRPAGDLVVAEVSATRREQLAAAYPDVAMVDAVVAARSAPRALWPTPVCGASCR
jgi:NADP oxidoreductase coenzyme F420-dependent